MKKKTLTQQVVNTESLARMHGGKGRMMGVIQDYGGLAEPADVWSIHSTSGP